MLAAPGAIRPSPLPSHVSPPGFVQENFFPENGIVGHKKEKRDILYTGKEYWQKICFSASTWLLSPRSNPWNPWQGVSPGQGW